MDLAPGATVDRYVIDGILGEGGMAIVYRCHHAQLSTQHALKLLTMSSRAIRERLVVEGQVQATLRHKNIVAVTDIILVNGAPGLVMEYIEGPSLDELLDQQRLDYDQADALVEGLLAGVAHAHATGLVHRDLKPANIMLAVEGQALVPKVMDFGLAKLLEGDPERKAATKTGSTMGTPQYMSPEQVEDSKNVDHRTDVFACGAILYEMVTGHRAFSGDSLYKIFGAVAEGQYRNPRELRPDLPQRMENAILGALTPDKDQRIGSIDELLAVWRGEKMRAGVEPAVPKGPFSADFVASVRSMSTELSTSTPDPTFQLEGNELQVESVFSGPPVAVPSAVAAAPPERVAAVVQTPAGTSTALPARSMVKGTAVVMGGSALVVGLGVGAVVLVLGGVLGAWMFLPESTVRIVEVPVMASPMPAGSTPSLETPSVAKVAPQPVDRAPRPVARPAPVVVEPAPVAAPVAAPVVAPVPAAEPEPVAVSEPGVEPEPGGEPVPDAPDPVPGPTSDVARELASADAEVRRQAIDAAYGKAALTPKLVELARNDPSSMVKTKAWDTVLRQYNARVGDVTVAEGLVLESIRTGRYTQADAVRAYGAHGTDPEKLAPALRSGRAKMLAVDAVVSIGQRVDRERARTVLRAGLKGANPLVYARLQTALVQLQ